MPDPILYTLRLGTLEIPVRWYGLLLVAGALAGTWYAAWYIKRKDENPEIAWDALIWLLIAGVVGARLGHVIVDILSGSRYYLSNPLQVLYINQGGLNILGGIIVAVVVAWYFARRRQIDFWLLADAAGPALLIGMAIGLLGTYFNQEMYGPPTTLPWGMPIDAAHRLPPWQDLAQFPVETTRFHPLFAYEILWSLVWAGILVWLILKRGHLLRTGVIAASALIVSGVGRTWIELLRPDSPRFLGTPISTSVVLSVLLALAGLFILLVKLEKISVSFIQPGSTAYVKRAVRRPPRQRAHR